MELTHVSAIYLVVTTIIYVMYLSFTGPQTLCVCHVYIQRRTETHTHRGNVNYRAVILLSDSNDAINQGNEV